MEQLQQELELLAAGIEPAEEKLSPLEKQMPLIIGADGVMVPIRPQEKTPKGQTLWREVKVAILARLEQGINSKGKPISQLHHRRKVAVLGDIETLKPRLWLEALRCGFRGSTVAWRARWRTGILAIVSGMFLSDLYWDLGFLPWGSKSLSGCCCGFRWAHNTQRVSGLS